MNCDKILTITPIATAKIMAFVVLVNSFIFNILAIFRNFLLENFGVEK